MNFKPFSVLGLLVLVAGCTGNPKDKSRQPSSTGINDSLDWDTVIAYSVPKTSSDWGTPVFLEVSRTGWFESLSISPDGEKLYAFHYPASMDMFNLRLNGGPFTDDGDIRVSEAPFRTHHKVNKYYLSEDLYTAAGVMVDEDGNFWYTSNREGRHDGWVPGDYDNENIFRNDELLAFNKKDKNYANPHYCRARDELWFDCIMDERICVLKNASANGFSGEPEEAPEPINLNRGNASHFGAGLTTIVNAQPWLSPDCNTMYFTSNRGRGEGSGPWIYRSFRKGDNWAEPEPVVYGDNIAAVGDPTLTADMSRLFYVQFLMNEQGNVRTGLFYVERI